jgi:hypothetical protein
VEPKESYDYHHTLAKSQTFPQNAVSKPQQLPQQLPQQQQQQLTGSFNTPNESLEEPGRNAAAKTHKRIHIPNEIRDIILQKYNDMRSPTDRNIIPLGLPEKIINVLSREYPDEGYFQTLTSEQVAGVIRRETRKGKDVCSLVEFHELVY